MALPLADGGGPYANLAYSALPTTQVLSGSGTPGTGGTSISSYAWTIIDVPTGSAAALSSGTAQNPTLNGIDLPGTYRVKLVVTDDIGGVSESSTLEAPDLAFADVCVTTENLALEIPAASERNWKDKTAGWAAALDTLDGEVAPATTSALGTVKLSEAPVSSATPVAVTQDRFTMSVFVPGLIAASPGAGNPAQSLVSIPVYEACNLVKVAYAAQDAGTVLGLGYVIDVYVQDGAEYSNNTFNAGDLVATMTFVAGVDNQALEGVNDVAFDRACSARDVVSFKVSTAPAGAGDQGSDFTLTAWFRRKW